MSGTIGTSHSKSKVIGRSIDTPFAWIKFDQSGTDAIDKDFGFSSVATGGTAGNTVCHFSTNPPTADYGVTMGGGHDPGGSESVGTFNIGNFTIACHATSGNDSNNNDICCTVWHV